MLGNVGVPYRTEGAQDGRSTETPGLRHRPKLHPRLRACPCGATSRFQVVLKVSFLNGDLKCVHHMRIPQRAATEVHTSPALFQSLCSLSCVRLFVTPWTVARQAPFVHGASPGKNTGVGCHALLQGIFPTLGLNPGLPHFRRILYRLNHQGGKCVPCTFLLPGFSI